MVLIRLLLFGSVLTLTCCDIHPSFQRKYKLVPNFKFSGKANLEHNETQLGICQDDCDVLRWDCSHVQLVNNYDDNGNVTSVNCQIILGTITLTNNSDPDINVYAVKNFGCPTTRYWSNSSQTCLPRGHLGSPCTADFSCLVSGSHCVSTGQYDQRQGSCECSALYVAISGLCVSVLWILVPVCVFVQMAVCIGYLVHNKRRDGVFSLRRVLTQSRKRLSVMPSPFKMASHVTDEDPNPEGGERYSLSPLHVKDADSKVKDDDGKVEDDDNKVTESVNKNKKSSGNALWSGRKGKKSGGKAMAIPPPEPEAFSGHPISPVAVGDSPDDIYDAVEAPPDTRGKPINTTPPKTKAKPIVTKVKPNNWSAPVKHTAPEPSYYQEPTYGNISVVRDNDQQAAAPEDDQLYLDIQN